MTYQIHILPSCQVLFILFFPYPRLLFLLLSLLFYGMSFIIPHLLPFSSFVSDRLLRRLPAFFSSFLLLLYSLFFSTTILPSLPSPSPPPLFLCLLSFLYPSNSSPPFFCVHLAYLSSPLFNRFSSTSYIFLLFFVFIFSLLLFISLIFFFTPFSFRFPAPPPTLPHPTQRSSLILSSLCILLSLQLLSLTPFVTSFFLHHLPSFPLR